MQYNAVIAITGAIRGTSSEKLYNNLEDDLGNFYKIYKNKSPYYLYN